MIPMPHVLRRLPGRLWQRRSVAIPLLLAAAVTGSASGISLIRVHSGDTLSAIAVRYHTTVDRLIALNHLPGNGNLIFAGQTLRVPGGHTTARRGHRVVTHHVVVQGDTLYGLAARYHVQPAVIVRRNHLPSSLVVMLGQRLAIPHRVHTAPHGLSSAATAATSAAERDRRILLHHAEPSRDAVAALIRATAARWHLDPRLALAISWQESGFNMRVVSPVGAIGAMQVMPYTAAYIARDVVHRPIDVFDANDNITAGVALLSVLTNEASSVRQAVAGYYQGLQSVRDHGMYASTKQYVANVMALHDRV